MPQIFVCGAINLDITMKTSRFPHRGETLTGGRVGYCQGGKGANQAVAAARAGAAASFIGRVGADEFGKRVTSELKQKGVKLHVTESATDSTGVAVILVDDVGESSVVVDLGANQSIDFPRWLEFGVLPGDIVLVQNEVALEVSLEFAAVARQIGATVVFNASPFNSDCTRIFPSCGYLIVNMVEFSQIMLQSPASMTLTEIESELRSGDGPIPPDVNIIVTVGAHGVRASFLGDYVELDGYNVNTIDTTGAGDCFCGAFAAALGAGLGPEGCLAFSNAAAAISVQSLGAGPSMPSYESIEAFLRANS